MNKLAIVALVSAALAGVASAGAFNHNAVYVGPTGANGTTYGARNSGDTVEYIECYSRAQPGWEVAACFASDGAGRTVMCASTDPGVIATVRSISSASYLTFSVDARTGACTDIRVDNGSRFLE